jgi:acetyl-CoA carboxylase biotin carboxyl carrier protein
MTHDLLLTPEDVADIVAVLDGSHFERLDIRTPRYGLKIARSGAGWTQELDFSDAGEPAAAAVASAVAQDDGGTGAAVRAPLPGTFYRAPQPGAPPFVDVGDLVGPDTVVGIIETMKLMNSVHAGVSGVVEAILADNATMVAGGEVLMRLAEA